MARPPAPKPPPKPKPPPAPPRFRFDDPADLETRRFTGSGQFAEYGSMPTPVDKWGRPTLPLATSPPIPEKRRPKGRGIVLPAIRPNAGLRVRYAGLLDGLVGEMHADVTKAILTAYAAEAPGAQDATPASILQGVMRRLGRRWSARFDTASQELARYFAMNAKDRADGAFEAILRKAGFTVPFRITPAIRDALEAAVAENVTLIKSIGSEYLTQVEGHVMRSVTAGHDMHQLATNLEAQYGVTKRRAALIARDQNSKATATIARERQIELGLKAIWRHSAGGKKPRPSHVANNGKVYDPKVGWYDPDAKERVWPGSLVNCRCVSNPYLPYLEGLA
jgi:SPP1 gp7 family putative phage head morphogenesis protein